MPLYAAALLVGLDITRNIQPIRLQLPPQQLRQDVQFLPRLLKLSPQLGIANNWAVIEAEELQEVASNLQLDSPRLQIANMDAEIVFVLIIL